MEKRLDIKTRKWRLKYYPDCFVGSQATKMMIKLQLAEDEQDALQLGDRLIQSGLIQHVTNAHQFENRFLFYQFTNKYQKAKAQETEGL